MEVDALLYYQLSSATTYEKLTYTRFNILSIISALGGLMYTVKNIGNAINRKTADFSVDSTLLRKLYTVNKIEDPLFQKHDNEDK